MPPGKSPRRWPLSNEGPDNRYHQPPRDQHREEVTNYAIAGDAVWIFSAQGRKKIALSDLDLPATVKVNDDRGVEFRVPPVKGS